MLKALLKILLGLVILVGAFVVFVVLSLRPTPPTSTFELMGESIGDPEAPPYLIFGATGGTGYEVTKLLRERGDRVTAFVRPTSNTSQLEPLGVELIVGDGMNYSDVRGAVGDGNYRAVLTTIGCLNCDPPPDFIANKHVIDAAAEAGVKRLILVTSLGVAETRDAVPWLSRQFLAEILPLKEQAERHLMDSDLDYTIIRPGGLPPDTEPTGRGVLTEDPMAFGFIGRPDLGRLIVGCFDDDRSVGKAFAAMDPQRKSPWDAGQ
ncbi:MAG: SDR family oxidoreductase [Gammaproteobacteria bacterium]|nr:SDR family oxidoreductase [Gammaproteobacteria bacterium]